MPKGKRQKQTDIEVLSPKPVVWTIGGKDYEQRPLTIDRLGDVINELVDVVVSGGRGALLDQLVGQLELQAEAEKKGLEGANIKQNSATIPLIARIVASIPKALPRVVAMILDAKEAEMRKHLDMRTAIAIIRTFLVQNEVGAILADFFGLLSDLRMNVTDATAVLAETSPEASNSESEGNASED